MNTNSLNSSKVPASSIPKFDVFDFQIHQRQFMNELQIKRDQVAQLKKEIDAANLKIHELSRSLETAKNVNEEQQHNLNLALKNVRFHEDKLQTKRDSMARTHIQQESIIQERESLRGVLQSVELQNYSLMREFNELKAQYNCDVTSQKDLLNQDVKVRAKIAELTEAIQKFQIDQKEIMELKSKVEEQESLQKNVSFYMDKYYECKNNYVILEVKYIKVNAALQKYEELLTGKIPENISPEIQIVLDQWEKATEWFHQQSEIQKTIIENLSYALKVEKEGNIKICKYEAGLEMEKEELLKEIEELKTKLNYYLKEYKDCETQTEVDIKEVKTTKNEIIEITDEN